jgi:hypothetical protein
MVTPLFRRPEMLAPVGEGFERATVLAAASDFSFVVAAEKMTVMAITKGAENRITRVLPNPDNSCAYDSSRIRACQKRTIMILVRTISHQGISYQGIRVRSHANRTGA